MAAAQRFADAFNRLVPEANGDGARLLAANTQQFEAQAAVWRTLATKPPLNPDADRHWILAENALKEKDFDSAVEHYQAALKIQPMWPTGWYDLAMMYAEQKNYFDAMDAMRHYLELVPDATDAKSAREQMTIWEDKSKHALEFR